MSPRHWNLIAEILGFARGCLLLWPAVMQNTKLRRLWVVATRLRKSKLKLASALDKSPSVLEAGTIRWSASDQWLLTFGAATLVLSFSIKFFVVLYSP